MGVETDGLYHVLVLFAASIGVFSVKRVSMIILLFMLPVIGEILQVFIPDRIPDLVDVFHGYLGILLGFCLVRVWREVKPVETKVQTELKKKAPENR